jgi:hypothetical protein
MKAFPTSGIHYTKDGVDMAQEGMNLRDYFAAKAMQALLANDPDAAATDDLISKGSYEMADAMMKAREK